MKNKHILYIYLYTHIYIYIYIYITQIYESHKGFRQGFIKGFTNHVLFLGSSMSWNLITIREGSAVATAAIASLVLVRP